MSLRQLRSSINSLGISRRQGSYESIGSLDDSNNYSNFESSPFPATEAAGESADLREAQPWPRTARKFAVVLLSVFLIARSCALFFYAGDPHRYVQSIYVKDRKALILDTMIHQEIVIHALFLLLGTSILISLLVPFMREDMMSLYSRKSYSIFQLACIAIVCLVEIMWLVMNDFLVRYLYIAYSVPVVLGLCTVLAFLGPPADIFVVRHRSVKIGPVKAVELLCGISSLLVSTGMTCLYYGPIYDYSFGYIFTLDTMMAVLIFVTVLYQLCFRHEPSIFIPDYGESRGVSVSSACSGYDTDASPSSSAMHRNDGGAGRLETLESNEDDNDDMARLLKPSGTEDHHSGRKSCCETVAKLVVTTCRFIHREIMPNIAAIIMPLFFSLKLVEFTRWHAGIFLEPYLNMIYVWGVLCVFTMALSLARLVCYLGQWRKTIRDRRSAAENRDSVRVRKSALNQYFSAR